MKIQAQRVFRSHCEKITRRNEWTNLVYITSSIRKFTDIEIY